ncbi:hypothetical protein TorRG33x02_253220, partial [Trema orientale]
KQIGEDGRGCLGENEDWEQGERPEDLVEAIKSRAVSEVSVVPQQNTKPLSMNEVMARVPLFESGSWKSLVGF